MKIKTWLAVGCTAAVALVSQAQQPNIIVIVADDLGLGDIGRQHTERTGNAPLAPTPAIDSLADDGLWFDDAHSPCALCAPSRYAFMTGNYTYRSSAPGGTWGAFQQGAITASDMTLGRITKAAGYNTGFIGKWHLGGDFHAAGSSSFYRGNDAYATPAQVDLTTWEGHGPQDMGFDYDFTLSTGVQGPVYVAHENASWYKFDAVNSSLIFYDANSASDPLFVSDKGPGVGDSHWDSRALNMLLAQKGADFITAQAPSAEPFFLYYCSPAVHIPHTPAATIDGTPIAGSTLNAHLDMNRVLDLEVKRMVDALKASGEYDNTLIIFTSDNGGLRKNYSPFNYNYGTHLSNGGYVNGYKNSRQEGGTLVPFICVWPDVIDPGSRSDSMINGTDILATLAAVAGQSFDNDQAMDSFNLLPVFTNSVAYEPRAELLYQGGTGNELILRQGKWKLVMTPSSGNYNNASRATYQSAYLYNLAVDPREQSNLVNNSAYTGQVADMFDRYWDLREAGTRTAPSADSPVVIPEPDIIYVDQATGNLSNSGTNWNEALPTIAAGIAAVGQGDQIWVAAGTYNEGALSIPSDTSIYGGFSNGQANVNERDFSANETILSPSKVKIYDVSNVRFDGFTLTGASGNWEYPIRVDTSSGGADVDNITVANCRITGNSVGATVLIRGWNGHTVGDVTLENCEISENHSAGNWLSIISANPIQGTLTVRNCSIFSNSVASTTTGPNGSGISFNGGNLLVENSLFYGNKTECQNHATSLHVKSGDSIRVVNTTFGSADAGSAIENGLVKLDSGNDIDLVNCIFANSPQAALVNNRLDASQMRNCLFYNNGGNHISGGTTANTEAAINALSWATGCVVTDPAFADSSDFSLTPGSGAIDAGLNGQLTAGVTTDLKGAERLAGLSVDIGAYEIQDQDGDRLPDNYEMAHTVPASPVSLLVDSDSDSDGLTAFAEYAFGMNPTVVDDLTSFVQSMTQIDSQEYQTLSYPRNRSAMNDAAISMLRSTNLVAAVPWFSGQTIVVNTEPDGTNTLVELVTERSVYPATAQPQEFLKVEVAPKP